MNPALATPGLSTNPMPATTGRSNNKALWMAIIALGLCVLALAAVLVQTQVRANLPNTPLNASLTSSLTPGLTANPAPMESSGATPQPVAISSPTPAKIATAKPVAAAPAKAKTQVNGSGNSNGNGNGTEVVAQAPASAPLEPVATKPAPAICNNCGTVESVTPITREGQGSGVGAVAGGVLGAVVGNQVGKGNGRAAATVLGAVGGGWAGNAVEKNMKKTTAYSVRVRMQDGTSRVVEQSAAPMVGAKVTVDGNVLRPA